MNRANQFATNLTIWTGLFAMMITWVVVRLKFLTWGLSPSIQILQTRIKMVLAILQLKERHLYEDIVIRHIGLSEGVCAWDTTLGLAYKTVAYLLVRLLNVLLQRKFNE